MEEKKGLFGLFGKKEKEKPDLQPEDTTPTLLYFFKLLWRKASKLLTLNLMMLVQILPLVACVLIYMLGDTIPTVNNATYGPLLGTYLAGGSPAAASLLPLFMTPLNIPVLSTWRLVVIIVLLAFTVLTWGLQQVGAAYNLRSLVRGDSCFLWSDYFYAIGRNWKQGLLFGVIDIVALAVIACNIAFYMPLATDFWNGLAYGVVLVVGIIYIVMRFYIYNMMITFDLSIGKLLKNALIFTALGIKRNALALLGLALVVVLNIALIWGGLSIGFSVPIVLPFFYVPALFGFISTYAAYPVIQRHMIDPYLTEEEMNAGGEETTAREEGGENDAPVTPEEAH